MNVSKISITFFLVAYMKSFEVKRIYCCLVEVPYWFKVGFWPDILGMLGT